ncbi:PREDICTED: uncharacterized protein LOC109126483 [Camelina sativa]|uniref:Uncharacterized protein LOC109126483 n=1 Tax=Camelina sativa TaxID=90675 RepID=A0ABM1QFR7_CAMSA|nr:PREDICTED: uncharacterized protein LOC109126483 [Camelina sativa]
MNTIHEIQCGDGRVVKGDDIKTEAEKYFREFLQFLPTDYEGISIDELQELLPFRCSLDDQTKLTSTIIANRLKQVLPKFISGNQSAFVADRLLIENVLLATKLGKDYHKDSISERCAIKIDISKAFDFVQWSFLLNVLATLSFPPQFIQWIKLCITTASFSVQVDGELAGYFQSSRGLRQGCSLSPYLFVICMDVLSKLLDKVAGIGQFDYHPRCRNIGLTHLSFADDLMVLSDGKLRSIAGIVDVFDKFAKFSGLKINMEKYTLFSAGVTDTTRQQIATEFLFDVGQLPVSSVIWSTCNFWLSVFHLPRSCIREIEQICSAFLWSGANMNLKKSKLPWQQVCKLQRERGLGLRILKEANDVCCLKLVWRIVSHSNSLWVRWVDRFLLKNKPLWLAKETVSLGSWIWKKILKYKALAESFCKVEVVNGVLTSFWLDNWSPLGKQEDVVGRQGILALGIGQSMIVAEAWSSHRQRRHRQDSLNVIEEVLFQQFQRRTEQPDVVLWRGKNDVYHPRFSTKDIWNHIRTTSPTVAWHRGVWFLHAMPKYSFCVWLAVHNRLATGDGMIRWTRNLLGDCLLCHQALETRDHLFFSCGFASKIWAALAEGVYKAEYTTHWPAIITYLSNQQRDRTEAFLSRYVFQALVYAIWKERNGRRHGESAHTAGQIVKWVDRQVRNQFLAIQWMRDQRYDQGLQLWFSARI